MMSQVATLPLALLVALAAGVPMGLYGLVHANMSDAIDHGWGVVESCCAAATMVGHGMVEDGHHSSVSDCPHHGRAEGYRGDHQQAELQLVVVTGKVVEKNTDLRLITIETGRGEVVVKLLRVYVDERTGYLVSGDWLAKHIREGDTITVEVHGRIAYSLEWSGQSYVAP
jgi:hypothetical protein